VEKLDGGQIERYKIKKGPSWQWWYGS